LSYPNWLVVSTPLKNISQVGLLFPIYGKKRFMFQTTNQPKVFEVGVFHLMPSIWYGEFD